MPAPMAAPARSASGGSCRRRRSEHWPSVEDLAAPGGLELGRHARDYAALLAPGSGVAAERATVFDLVGRSIANAHLLLDLEVVVLIGGVTALGEPFRAAIEAAFLAACPPEFRHGLVIRLGALGRLLRRDRRRGAMAGERRAMRVVTADDYDDLSRRAAALVIDAVRERPDSVLVLPTGATPLGMFRELSAAADGKPPISAGRVSSPSTIMPASRPRTAAACSCG